MKRIGDNIYVNLAGNSEAKSCERKKSYLTEVQAKEQAHIRSLQTNEHIMAYKCHYSNHWHIGHSSGLSRHLETRVTCPYACGRPVRKSRLDNHVTRCPNRPQ